jgi:hypothetical protein
MLTRRTLSLVLAVSFIAAFALAAVPMAHADYLMNFDSVLSSCESGTYTVRVTVPTVSVDGALVAAFNARVEVLDFDGTKLGEDTFGANYGGTYTGTITYSQKAVGPTVTFYLYYSRNDFAEVSAAQQQEILADTAVADAACKVIPGCDTTIAIPSTAVVGWFVTSAAAYWRPGQLVTNPPITIDAGKTYYVIGQDQSQQYYKILLGCDFVWVLKSTVGPNFDDVWHGMPLPTAIVN